MQKWSVIIHYISFLLYELSHLQRALSSPHSFNELIGGLPSLRILHATHQDSRATSEVHRCF